MTAFNPDTDIGSLDGKIILVTGGNNGLGKEMVLRLAKHNPKNIFLCSRTRSKGQEAIKSIQDAVPNAAVTLLDLDLASFASIKSAVETFLGLSDRLDILVNNAGVMMMPATKTVDGYDVQWGTNHMGHFLLTKLLLPTLLATASQPGSDVRILNLASIGSNYAPPGGINFADTSLPDAAPLTRYGQSKLANILFTKKLAEKYPSIVSVAVHPGGVGTTLADTWLSERPILSKIASVMAPLVLKTVEEGAKNQLWCATVEKSKLKNGGYYHPVGKENAGKKEYTEDSKLIDDLWSYSEEELRKHGYSD